MHSPGFSPCCEKKFFGASDKMKAFVKWCKRLRRFSFDPSLPLQICYARITFPARPYAARRRHVSMQGSVPARYRGRFPWVPPSLPPDADPCVFAGKMLRKSYRIGAFQITAEKFRFFGFCILTKQRSGVMILHVAAVAERLRQRLGSIAQLGEHLPYKQRVTGSSPVVPTKLWPGSSVG